jgi:hypothetical protein
MGQWSMVNGEWSKGAFAIDNWQPDIKALAFP